MPDAKILIVEDEGIEALDMKQRLKSLGYTVSDIASAGEEAVKKAVETRPDLVLMDIMLQGKIDGVTAAEQIHGRFDIPVVYLTAFADDDTFQRAKITEPYGYIVKPFHERELHITIETALYKHKMERKLIESERWLATSLRSIGDAVIATDKDGLITFMNPVAEGLMGWKIDEAFNKRLTEVFNIVNMDTRQPVENPVAAVIQHGAIVGLANHTLLIARDGTEIPIDDSAAPIRDDRGNIIGVILVFRDVTERVKAESQLQRANDELEMRVQERTRELREANTLLQAEISSRRRAEQAAKGERKRFLDVLETLPAYVVLLSADYHVPFDNRFFRERFGESHGRRCFEYLFNRTKPCEICETYTVMKTMAPHEWEWTGPDGRNYYIYDFPFVDTDGSTLILEMGIDITEQKQAHEALQKLNETLEQRVTERTTTLRDSEDRYRRLAENLEVTVKKQVAELRQAQTLAALGQMISVVAHEIRNPLHTINMGIDTLQKAIQRARQKPDIPEVSEIIEEIAYGSKMMNNVIDELLYYARHVTLEPSWQAVRDVVDSALGLTSHKLENISVHVSLDQTKILVDSERMTRVLMNLISNAADAMSDGGKLHIYTHRRETDDAGVLRLCVSDTGCGISEENMEKIYEPFFTTKTKGAGLGIPICKKLIEAHDGALTITSKLGEGTTAEIALPL
ncbi:MAG: response regulator [Candidatus Lindowbacteria bacterium]|nr:response regulator [Candidatus Lindowbacteria bacterium]